MPAGAVMARLNRCKDLDFGPSARRTGRASMLDSPSGLREGTRRPLEDHQGGCHVVSPAPREVQWRLVSGGSPQAALQIRAKGSLQLAGT